jgi:hypothetical protein
MLERSLDLERILYITNEASRFITIILDQPFYESSAVNSGTDAWFPFYGFSEKEIPIEEGTLPVGWLIKNENTNIPVKIKEEIKEACRFKSDKGEFAQNLIARFTNLPCLIISSILGGGVWDKQGFKDLKRFLMREYKEYYDNFPKFVLLPVSLEANCKDKAVRKIQELNNWLITRVNNNEIKTAEDFMEINLNTLNKLKQQLSNNQSLKVK